MTVKSQVWRSSFIFNPWNSSFSIFQFIILYFFFLKFLLASLLFLSSNFTFVFLPSIVFHFLLSMILALLRFSTFIWMFPFILRFPFLYLPFPASILHLYIFHLPFSLFSISHFLQIMLPLLHPIFISYLFRFSFPILQQRDCINNTYH